MTEIICPDCGGLGGERWHESDGSENGQKCPACDGFGHIPKKDTNASERQARSRQARASAGGKQIAVMLTPAAAVKLADHVVKGETIAGVVNRLLERSKP